MRRKQFTLKASSVHHHARELLVAHLELEDYKESVPARLLATLLLLAASWQASLSCVCYLVPKAPSHETVRKSLYACLPPKPRTLRERLLAALHETVPEHLRRQPQAMALDLHQRPYYGKFTRGATRREKKRSTRKSFTYATLAVLTPAGCFTLGLLLTRPYMRLTTLLEELLAQAQQAGIRPAYLLMDKEFYAAEVVEWLQKHNLPFLMPAKKRGRKVGGGNAHLFAPSKAVGWYDYEWTTPRRRRNFATGKRYQRGTVTVTVRMGVARHPSTGKPLVYASWHMPRWSPAEVVRTYRRRFGIEARYRQLGQALAPTTNRDERVRLLLVGVALLLCNLWAWLHSEVFGSGPVSERQLHLAALRLPFLLRALAATILAELGGPVLHWMTHRPIPQAFFAQDCP
jgi:hypothetical protein